MADLLKGRIRLSTILLAVFFAITLTTYIMVRPDPDHSVSKPKSTPTSTVTPSRPAAWTPQPSDRPSTPAASSHAPSTPRAPSPPPSPHASSPAEEPPASGPEGD